MRVIFFSIAIFFSLVSAEDILLTRRGGVFHVPGIINKVRLEFVVDSGASLV